LHFVPGANDKELGDFKQVEHRDNGAATVFVRGRWQLVRDHLVFGRQNVEVDLCRAHLFPEVLKISCQVASPRLLYAHKPHVPQNQSHVRGSQVPILGGLTIKLDESAFDCHINRIVSLEIIFPYLVNKSQAFPYPVVAVV